MELSTNESSMQIMDLGFECLENCLRHMTIEELLNVADSNKEMRDAARYFFKRKHGRKLVHFIDVLKFRNGDDEHTCECCRRQFYGSIRLTDKTLTIVQLKLGLQFLRCFGDLVSEIEFRFCRDEFPHHISQYCQSLRNEIIQGHSAHEWEHLLIGYINEYCSESLSNIKFYGSLKNYFNHDLNKLTKPFLKVEKLKSNLFFPAQKKLHELFPKLRELDLRCVPSFSFDGVIFLGNEFMANRFPYLEHLNIQLSCMYKCNIENFAIALRLNPQIKTLTGNIWFEVLFDTDNFNFWNANEDFQNLERLELVVVLDVVVYPKLIEILTKPVNEDLHFKNLKEFKVQFYTINIPDTVTEWIFPVICDKLESLTISAAGHKLEEFLNLLNKHPTVKKLEIRCNAHEMTFDDCSRVSKAFPLLEEIFFTSTPYDFVGAIEMFHSLKYFKYYTGTENSYVVTNRLRPLNSWSVSNTPESDFKRLIEGKRNC